ncbi:MAG: class I SAM-dependent methyltransferase [Burkholderiales bacterium]
MYTRANPSPRYQTLLTQYRQMHLEGERFLNTPPEETFPGMSLPAQAGKIKALIEVTGAENLLDYGSGKGQQYLLRNVRVPDGRIYPSIEDYWDVDFVECYDPCYRPFSDLPSGQYDGVICTDVLEHCPEEDLRWIIDELFRFSGMFVFANVACYPARKRLPTGENAHCTIQPPAWWAALVQDIAAGYPERRWEFWIQWKEEVGGQSEFRETPLRSAALVT